MLDIAHILVWSLQLPSFRSWSLSGPLINLINVFPTWREDLRYGCKLSLGGSSEMHFWCMARLSIMGYPFVIISIPQAIVPFSSSSGVIAWTFLRCRSIGFSESIGSSKISLTISACKITNADPKMIGDVKTSTQLFTLISPWEHLHRARLFDWMLDLANRSGWQWRDELSLRDLRYFVTWK